MKSTIYDYIVIGSGIAGLSAALRLSKFGKTVMISKNSLKSGSTHYAQGGIAVALDKSDAPSLHYQDTLEAGAGLCDSEVVKVLVEEGLERVKELIDIGAEFDKKGSQFDFGQEGAHHRRRILHAKDETGKEIERALGTRLLKEPNITFLQNTMVVNLCIKNEKAVGCVVLKGSKYERLSAKATIIATGGCGQVFSHSTNPSGTTGDGIALAYDAGCLIQDMEFIQFHPTTLYTGDKKPISIFLISEAVRGEGAVLRNIKGNRFMKNYHDLRELAPRDIVSRAIVKECIKSGSNHVYLDLTQISGDLSVKFPNIYRRCLIAKIDLTKDFVPVSPAAHFLMGGIKVNEWGKSSIEGLYSTGESACLGIHGANRLASNSLLDGLVFGYRCGDYVRKNENDLNENWDVGMVFNGVNSEKLAEFQVLKYQIKEMMWKCGGIVRNQQLMQEGLDFLKSKEDCLNTEYSHIIYYELKNIFCVSKLILDFGLKRRESRGGHFREDFPETDNLNWKIHQSTGKKMTPFLN
ncbi:L-aspartate oxidase [bacterium]|jgi:L-aspartate oxidase|nr:L-aspartate oxidase [bacterium]